MTEVAPPPPRASKPQPRLRDDVFWTELEIRRLSNLVAECIHSKRYAGRSLQATEERQQLHVYLDAMKRKALRILHRAETFVQQPARGTASWPGIDKSIVDPVSLADAYVGLVENYQAIVQAEEEEQQKREREEEEEEEEQQKREQLAVDNEGGDDMTPRPNVMEDEVVDGEQEEWEKQDKEAFEKAKEASERREHSDDEKADERAELLQGAPLSVKEEDEGVRNRKRRGVEDVMAEHQPVQDELTSKLADVVGQLKESVTENQGRLDKDSKVLQKAEDAVDRNVDALQRQRKKLDSLTQSSSLSWKWIALLVVLALAVFVFVLLLIFIPM